MATQTTIIPHSQEPLVSRTYPSDADLDAAIAAASNAQKLWAKKPVSERIAIGRRFMVYLQSLSSEFTQILQRMSSEPWHMRFLWN